MTTMTETKNWKSSALLTGISTLGLLLVSFSLIATLKLPFLGHEGLLSWLVLIVLTLAASRFTVSIGSSCVHISGRHSLCGKSCKHSRTGHPARGSGWIRLDLWTLESQRMRCHYGNRCYLHFCFGIMLWISGDSLFK